MTIPQKALIGVALLAMAQAAQAAPPKVAGKYAVMLHVLCNARISTSTANFQRPTPPGGSGPAVTSVNSLENGELSIGVGFMTFPAVAASSGNASLSLNFVGGDVLRVNGSGNSVGTHTENLTGTFALQQPTATSYTFTYDQNGAAAPPPMVFTMSFGDVVTGGVARTLYLVRRESASCLNAMTATKQ